jgi:hypothetical protein
MVLVWSYILGYAIVVQLLYVYFIQNHECHFKYGKTIGNISCGSFAYGVLLHNNVNNFDIEESAIVSLNRNLIFLNKIVAQLIIYRTLAKEERCRILLIK